MLRKDLYLTNSQVRFLRKLEGNMTEHIRRAIDRYIDEIKMLKVAKSPSISTWPKNTYVESSNKEGHTTSNDVS